MSVEQTGRLKRVRTKGQLGWRLEWEFKGRTESRDHNVVFPRLDPVLQQLDAPEGTAYEVRFTFKPPHPESIRLADQSVAQEATDKDREREAASEGKARLAQRQVGVPFGQPKAWQRASISSHFHNPYNFIPAPDGMPPEGSALGHHAPKGHHVYHPCCFSGRISLRLTVETPLIVSDAARGERSPNGHLTVDPLTDEKGNPVIPITSFKGALRSAYEAITCSRLGVFRGHDEKLGRRMAAGEGLAMVPARIGDNGTAVELWMGTQAPRSDADWTKNRPKLGNNNRWEIPGGTMYAAWLPAYTRNGPANQNGPNLSPARPRYADGTDPKHGDPVVCWLRKAQKLGQGRPVFSYWRVEDVRAGHDAGKLPAQASRSLGAGGNHAYVEGEQPIRAIGYVCRTGQNFSRKHDERVFFVPLSNAGAPLPPFPAPLAHRFDELAANWKRLIADYREVAKDAMKRRGHAPPSAYLGRDPGKTAFSRHIYDKDVSSTLRPGSLCYALIHQDGKVAALYPVMIARELADFPPEAAVPANMLPAEAIDELSAADRVFGWVSQKGAAGNNRNMFRGQLRIASLRYEHHPQAAPIAHFNGAGLPLAILSTPKPQQARFYLAADRAGTPPPNGKSADDTFYKGDPKAKSVRGRKVFPHHKHTTAVPNYWEASQAIDDPAATLPHAGKIYHREFVRQNKEQDEQNRTITGWITPQTTFTAEIDVINLAPAELGALLWLCDLPEGHVLRMGFGKPLGFGSVRLDLTGVDLADGEAVLADYTSLLQPGKGAKRLSSVEDARAEGGPIKDYKTALSALFQGHPAFDQIAVIKAFLAAAAGFDDGLPMHYPRATHAEPAPPVPPSAEGKNYEWFVANNREGRDRGPHLVLPPLWEETGLPYLRHEGN